MINSNLTEAQIVDLIFTLIMMQEENKVSKNGKKVVLSAELLELLEKYTLNRGTVLFCPKCGSVSVSKTVREMADSDICARTATEPLTLPMVLCFTIQDCLWPDENNS